MKQIFAPWRMDYITSRKPDGCIFCDLPEAGVSEETLVLYKGELAFVIMNRYPYVSGHLMIVPYRHAESPLELEPGDWAEVYGLVVPTMQALENVYRPQGFNIGINVGQAGGAGIHEHIHLHVIPRWIGDNNVVPVMTDTRVIPEALDQTWKRLLPEFEKFAKAIRKGS